MSGGSWEYMYDWETEKFLGRRADVQAMAKRLATAGYLDAARAMEEFYVTLNYAAVMIEARQAALRDLMHAVEWRDSNDYGEDQLQEVATAMIRKT